MDAEFTAIEVCDSVARATTLLSLEREIAEEHATTVLEVYAATVPSDYPRPVYDTTALELEQIASEPDEEAARRTLDRAVRYLDLREMLVRPFAGHPEFVAFKRGT